MAPAPDFPQCQLVGVAPPQQGKVLGQDHELGTLSRSITDEAQGIREVLLPVHTRHHLQGCDFHGDLSLVVESTLPLSGSMVSTVGSLHVP